MQHCRVVGGGQGARDLPRISPSEFRIERPLIQDLAERVALDKLHHHRRRVTVLEQIVDDDDMWVIEGRGDAGFVQQVKISGGQG